MALTCQAYLTISDAENYAHTTYGFIKVLEEHQMGKTLRVLVHHFKRYAEVLTAVWVLVDKVLE